MPLLVRAPGVAAGRVVRTPVSLVDVAPTLAGLLGEPLPAPESRPLDGRDLSAALPRRRREPAAGRGLRRDPLPRRLRLEPARALRRRDLKYISAARPELYDLAPRPRRGARPAGGPAEIVGADGERPKGFAARLAAIEAEAVPTPRAAPADAETRARLASLGYVASSAPLRRPPGEAGRPPLPIPARWSASSSASSRRTTRLTGGDAAAAAVGELAALVAADPRNPVFRGELAGGLARAGRGREGAAALPAGGRRGRRGDPEAWYNLAVGAPGGRPAGEARTGDRAAPCTSTRRGRGAQYARASSSWGRESGGGAAEFAAAAALDPRDADRAQQPGQRAARPGPARRGGRAPTARRGRSLRATPSRSTASARSRWSAIGRAAALPFFERALAARSGLPRGPAQPGHRAGARGGRRRGRGGLPGFPRRDGRRIRSLPNSAVPRSSSSPGWQPERGGGAGREEVTEPFTDSSQDRIDTQCDARFIVMFLIQRTPKEIEHES